MYEDSDNSEGITFVGGNRSTDAVKCGFVVDKMQFCIITEIRSEPSESICSGWCKQVPAEFCEESPFGTDGLPGSLYNSREGKLKHAVPLE